MRISRLAVPLVLAGVACSLGDERVEQLFRNPAAWIDLTHPLNDAAIFWPTAEPFRMETVSEGVTEGGWYYSAYNFTAAEHGGTHLDAPVHFAEGKNTTDEIPLARLIGPAVVVDAASQSSVNRDYLVSVADFEAFEAAHGPIPSGAIVLVRTGWGLRWPDPASYLGTTMRGPEAVPLLHFPGLAPEAAQWLVENRTIAAVGIDTPSIDRGQSTTFESHRILYAQDIPGFENVANLETMPEAGGYVIALPMKIEGGSGGPLRIVGVIPSR